MTGVSRSAIRDWRVRIEPERPVPVCTGRASGPAYAYLLGLYLGDGCISPQARGGYALRIACGDAWPGLIDACEETIRAVRPGNSVCRVRAQGCTMVTSYSNHWPCLFPQHGPGQEARTAHRAGTVAAGRRRRASMGLRTRAHPFGRQPGHQLDHADGGR